MAAAGVPPQEPVWAEPRAVSYGLLLPSWPGGVFPVES